MISRIRRFRRLDARLVPHRWDWAEANAAGIAAHWDARREKQPKLFDGEVLMVAGARLHGEGEAAALSLDLFATGYSRLLAHIDWGFPDPGVRNGFAMGALQGSDGPFVLGVMAAHTANAGRLYFPAGTPDRADLRPDGTVDLEGSLLREMREETGLPLGPEHLAPDWTLVERGGRAALMRGLRAERPAAALREAILAHIAGEAEPELSDVVLIGRPDEIDPACMPDFLPDYLAWRLAGGA